MAFLQEYTILGSLGKGSFAEVFKVRHNQLGYIRAIRVLNEMIMGENSKAYQNFLRECKVLLRLGNGSHPNIVHIYQPRMLENKALVEMDYVDGCNMCSFLRQNKYFVPVEEVSRMMSEISSALAYCHEGIYEFCMDKVLDNLVSDPLDGSKVLVSDAKRKELIEKYKVIHNDIHSGNIMRRNNGSYMLLDFGLAINGDEVSVSSSRRKNGAIEYTSPEKFDISQDLTTQSDIYSFGIVMYEFLAGRVPFPKNPNVNDIENDYLIGKAHREQTPPKISVLRKSFYEEKYQGHEYHKDFPDWMEVAIMKCLEKDPNKRFLNGMELYHFIERHIRVDIKQSDDLKNKVKQLENEKKSFVEKIGVLDTRLAELTLKAENDKNQLLEKDKENGVLVDKISLQDKTIGDLNSQLAELAAKIEKDNTLQLEKDKERETLIDKTNQQEKKINELNAQLAELSAKVENDKTKLQEKDKLVGKINQQEKTIDELNAKLAGLETLKNNTAKQVEKEKKVLAEEIAKQKKEIDELNAKLTSKADSRIKSLQDKINELNAEIESLRKNTSESTKDKKTNEIEQEFKALRKKYNNVIEQLRLEEDNYSKIKKEIELRDTIIDKLNKRISDITRLEKKNNELKKDNKELSNKLIEAEKTINTFSHKNSSKLFIAFLLLLIIVLAILVLVFANGNNNPRTSNKEIPKNETIKNSETLAYVDNKKMTEDLLAEKVKTKINPSFDNQEDAVGLKTQNADLQFNVDKPLIHRCFRPDMKKAGLAKNAVTNPNPVVNTNTMDSDLQRIIDS